jgi:hypothetical protein
MAMREIFVSQVLLIFHFYLVAVLLVIRFLFEKKFIDSLRFLIVCSFLAYLPHC